MIANVSAVDTSGDLAIISEEAEEPDIPDLYVEEDFNITPENIARYFPNGILASNYSNCELNFIGSFEDLGVLTISQKNVTFNGKNSLFINTVFDVENSDILLADLNFILNNSYYDNEGSAILVRANNITLNNIYINRTADANGNVKLDINLNPGDYIITSEYKGCRVSNNIKVLPILTGKDLTKKFGQPNQFEATLVDGQGKAYANQDVIFNINGVFYTCTTDANGVAKLNINLQAGKYIITSYYKEAVTSNTVTVTA